ncbi:MAG: Rpn family recombination-promoting nuclease/putative transposase [Chthoniobacterales bacterium]|nr:Rpn family recombination-promoting nuclease/putative transposase [Chthoniobacterales bacterium]
MKSETKKLVQFDWAIKTLLRQKANFPILAGFLSELLDTDVTIESLLESESNKNHSKDKSNRVDVLAQLGNGEKVIIEVRCERQWDFLDHARTSTHRASCGVAPVLESSSTTRTLRFCAPETPGRTSLLASLERGLRLIIVAIIYSNVTHEDDYIYHGITQFQGIHKKDTLQLSDKEKEHYPSHINHLSNIFPEYYLLKISGFDLKIRSTLDEWVYALKEAEVRPEFKAKGIKEAGEKLTLLHLSQEERSAYDRFIGDIRISRSTLESSFYDGIAQGKAEIILNLHRSRLPAEKIAELADMSLENVQEIIETNSGQLVGLKRS